MPTAIDNVEVSFEPSELDWRKTVVGVRVISRAKVGLRTHKQIDPAKVGDVRGLGYAIGAAAAIGAEQLDRKYGDKFTPEHCAQVAVKAFGEECKLQAEASKGFPIKLARVRAHAQSLSAQDQELLGRMEWRAKQNPPLTTSAEVSRVNDWIAAIHAGTLGHESQLSVYTPNPKAK